MKTNVLYYGDNLQILREHIPQESIDLIYLDPPFNSNRSYNVLFREAGGAASEAQIEAFEDTWHWGQAAAGAYEEVMTGPHQQVARMLKAMVDGLGHNDVTAYLTMMAVRLVELQRVLKPTGSLYLHCDPTAGPYLRVLMDSVFGPKNFKNEIVWHYGGRGAKAIAQQFPRNHDTILVYSKVLARRSFTQQYIQRRMSAVDARQRGYKQDQDGRWFKTAPRGDYTDESVSRLEAEGRIYRTRSGSIRVKYFLEQQGDEIVEDLQVGDVWFDIPDAMHIGKERLGYPTQKPLALLERIVSASSNPGDVVLDPFCGCGTAVHAAHKLGRRWIGIDITYLAIDLIERRLRDAFSGINVEVIGAPKDLAGARDLARRSKIQFQIWAVRRLHPDYAHPVGSKKGGPDKGIDGVISILVGGTAAKTQYGRAIVSVKGGEHVGVGMVRDLVGVLEREKEPIGILLTLEPPTQPMVTEAAAAGFYESELWQRKFPRVQIITVEEMLAGQRPDIPWGKAPFARASREKEKAGQEALL